jgi:hypothetical protein
VEIVYKAIAVALVLVKTEQKDDSQHSRCDLYGDASVVEIEFLSKECNPHYAPNYFHENQEKGSWEELL